MKTGNFKGTSPRFHPAHLWVQIRNVPSLPTEWMEFCSTAVAVPAPMEECGTGSLVCFTRAWSQFYTVKALVCKQQVPPVHLHWHIIRALFACLGSPNSAHSGGECRWWERKMRLLLSVSLKCIKEHWALPPAPPPHIYTQF